ncbi:MAG: ABC-type transport system, involved in lipoprotein release, permease [Hyphomicrobiales bacterium]|nr:ABC-type transport system, involved in lipoprotein release, permease [Hyphomicrobiales bacterium]
MVGSGTQSRRNKRIVLLGRTVVDKLFDADPIGQVIRVNYVPFKVVGILERKGQTLAGTDLDDTVTTSLGIARDTI